MQKRYSRSELEFLIEEWVIGSNSKRNKEIIKDKLIEGLNVRDIAAKYNLSETRVKTVVRTFRRTIEQLAEN